MQTNFSEAQLATPDIAEANDILRKCEHCGFCTATCPTYVLLGDELDSPRGRIYQIRDMLESGSHLSAIMRAGGWKSSAVLGYLSRSGIDRREAVEYMVVDSDSCDES